MASKSTLTDHLLVELVMITIFLLSFAPPSFSLTSSFNSSRIGHIDTNKSIGFTVPLFHSIYSPRSPFYNPNLTESDRIQVLLDLSYSRYHQYMIKSKSPSFFKTDDYTDSMEAPVTPIHDRYGGGEYMLSYKIGTPPVETFAIIDTGSSFTWLQCLPCELCFKQKTRFYDPRKSSTYARLKCDDRILKNCSSSSLHIGSRCNVHDNTCSYESHYVDESFTIGDLSTETLIFESDVRPPDSIALPNVPFGCGHKNNFTYKRMPPGIIGLDRGEISFTSQLGKNPKFSYCFLPMDSSLESETSYMRFGSAALFIGGKTPLIRNPKFPSRYFLNMEGISVGNERVQIPPGTFKVKPNGDGGFAIDSGTPFTYLHPDAFYPLVDSIKMKTPLTDLAKHYTRFKLCYWCTWNDILHKIPNVTFHFSGVDLELSKENTWLKLQSSLWNGMWCLALKPSPNRRNIFSILGNRQQRNINVGYDLEHNLISFKSTDCTRT